MRRRRNDRAESWPCTKGGTRRFQSHSVGGGEHDQGLTDLWTWRAVASDRRTAKWYEPLSERRQWASHPARVASQPAAHCKGSAAVKLSSDGLQGRPCGSEADAALSRTARAVLMRGSVSTSAVARRGVHGYATREAAGRLAKRKRMMTRQPVGGGAGVHSGAACVGGASGTRPPPSLGGNQRHVTNSTVCP